MSKSMWLVLSMLMSVLSACGSPEFSDNIESKPSASSTLTEVVERTDSTLVRQGSDAEQKTVSTGNERSDQLVQSGSPLGVNPGSCAQCVCCGYFGRDHARCMLNPSLKEYCRLHPTETCDLDDCPSAPRR